MTWETADADTVDLEADGQSVTTFPRTPNGTLSVEVSVSTVFTLVAENDTERTTQTVNVTVGTPDTTAPEIVHTPAVAPPAVEYYIQATDDAPAANSASSPAVAPANVHRFSVQPDDQAAPTINTTPVPPDQPKNQAAMISADVTDASGVAAVTLYYKRSSDTLYVSAPMTASGSVYGAQAPAQAVLPLGMDYYVEAEDVIMPPNLGRAPATAPVEVLSFSVVAVDRTPPAVTHTSIANGQAEGMPVMVSAEVLDDSGVGSVTLFYKARAFGTYTSVAMTGAGAQRTAQIPTAAVMQPAVDYYIETTDQATPTVNTGRVPSTAPGTLFAFTVSPVDCAPPTISHTPLADGPVPGAPLTITAAVVHGSGGALVNLHYRTQGGTTFSTAAMTAAGPTYSASLPGAAVVAPGLEYYFEAVDAAPMANTAVLPMGAPASTFAFDTGVGDVEPNGSTAPATPFLDMATPQAIGIGSISPANDQDFWIIDVPEGATPYRVDLEVTVGCVGVRNQADPALFLVGADGTTVLVSDDLDGVDSCPSIDPTVDRAARALTPGRYLVRVEEDGRNNTIAQYELRGRMDPVQRGNSILESAAGELCDDGNTTAGDGCSATCQFELVATFMAPGGTATEAVQPSGDHDLYAIVMGEAQFLTVFTSGAGGTGCLGDTVIELYDTDGVTRLGTDDDGGQSSCSNINPTSDPFAAGMAAGTYWLRVRGYSSSTQISSYEVNVQIAASICGNNSIEGNVDWYQVVAPADASIRAETWVATNGSCTSDTVIRAYAADRATQITTNDDDGLNRCSLLDPANDVAVRQLAAGRYYVTVEEYGNNSTIASYTLDIAILPPTCGDGWVGGTEQCDDGNTMAGDGCNANCAWEGAGEVELNDTRQTAGPLITSGNPSGTVLGVLETASDEDWYSIVVPAGRHLFAEVVGVDGGCPVDSALSLRSVTGTELASDTRDGPGECPRLSPGGDTLARNLTGGTYYLQVTGGTSNTTYILNARVVTPGCGDLYLDMGEQCDDGNILPGDGCNATCQYELAEMEPNDTSSAAITLTAVSQTVRGAIDNPNDEDWYSVTVANNARVAVFSHDGAIDQCPNVDARVAIYDDTGMTVLASDDSDGPRYCSAIYPDEAGPLAAGTYRIRVRAYSGTQTFP